MQHPEIHYDCVETGVCKSELFGIAFLKIDTCVATARLFDHLRRKINAGRNRSTSVSGGRNIPGAASDVEDARTSLDFGGVE
jgi:hypothetical protein